MMRLLLGGSKESFKTVTTQDSIRIINRYLVGPRHGPNLRSEFASLIEGVGGELVADSVSIVGASRFDKRFTTSLITQSNQELLGEVARIQQMALKDVETRTGRRTVWSLVNQLREESIEGQSVVSRLRGSLTPKLTDEEKVALASITGNRVYFENLKTIKPTEAYDIISPLVSMTGRHFISHIQSQPGLHGNDYILNAALRQSGLMEEIFMSQRNIDLDDLPSLSARDAANIHTGYSGISHTIVDQFTGEKFMTGNPFDYYLEHYFKKHQDQPGPAGTSLYKLANLEVAEKRLLSEIYASRSALGLSSFGSARTYEKTVHLPAVRRVLEAQGYEADEISSMIDYMKRSFAYDASPELKAIFEEMDAKFDTLGGLTRDDLLEKSKRLATARLKVLSPNMSAEKLAQFDAEDIGSYQYKYIFSESEAPIRRITGLFADLLEGELPLGDLDPSKTDLERYSGPIKQTASPAVAARITSTAQKAQQVAKSLPRQIAKATIRQKVGDSSAGKAFMSTMASSASGRKVLDLAKSASTLVKQFT